MPTSDRPARTTSRKEESPVPAAASAEAASPQWQSPQLDQILGLLQGLTKTVVDQGTAIAALQGGATVSPDPGAKSGGVEGAKVTVGVVDAAEPAIEKPEAGAAAAGGLRANDLTADQLVDLLASKLGGPTSIHVHDSIPWSPGAGLPVPARILQRQEAGAQVLTNLLKKLEITQLVLGYALLNPGAAAELDYDYVVAKRLDDVHQHLGTGSYQGG